MKYYLNLKMPLQRLVLLFCLFIFCTILYAQEKNTKTYAIDSAQIVSGEGNVRQSSCSQKLKEAQKAYDQGLLNSIPDMLKPCLRSGFTKIEELQGYRLLILAYLFLDDMDNASEYMNELLVYEPDYKPNRELDPIEYITLYNSFRINPFISFGVMVGVGQSSVRLVNDFSVGNTIANPTSYSSAFNPQGGVSFDILLYKKLFLTTDFLISLKSFHSEALVISSSRLNVTESQANVDVPVSFKYVFNKSKIRLYVRAGAALNYGLSSSAQMVRLNTETDQNDYAGPNVDLGSQRNKINFSAMAGVGANYKVGYGYILLDLRYYYGLSNITNASQRYSNDNFITQISPYGYISNDLALNNLQLSVGYMHSLYKIKKIKVKVAE